MASVGVGSASRAVGVEGPGRRGAAVLRPQRALSPHLWLSLSLSLSLSRSRRPRPRPRPKPKPKPEPEPKAEPKPKPKPDLKPYP